MSRFEGKIGDEGDEPADAAEILAALARDREPDSDLRRGAVSRYLSASEGWQEAPMFSVGHSPNAARG